MNQWLETCYFGQVTASSFASSLINRLDPTWKRKMNGQILVGQSPSLNLNKIRDELKAAGVIADKARPVPRKAIEKRAASKGADEKRPPKRGRAGCRIARWCDLRPLTRDHVLRLESTQ